MMASSASILSSAGARFSYSPSSFDAVQRQNPSSAQMPSSSSRRSSSFAVKAEGEGGSRSSINPDIRKSEAKVVDNVLVSDLEKPLTAYCRCWRSGTFPLCDGSHVKHNKATGDNVGPLLLKK